MPDFEVAVIGGGPAGHAAALRAAGLGARTALIEREKLGGACVNYSCLPTDVLLATVGTYLDARELAVAGVIDGVETFSFARAAARARSLVGLASAGAAASLRMAKVDVIPGRAAFLDRSRIRVEGETTRDITAEAFIIATGTRWEPVAIAGFATDRILTPDAVQSLTTVPESVVVRDDGVAATGFGAEYSFLLALAGAAVSLVTSSPAFLPGLDPQVGDVAKAALADAGVRILENAALKGDGGRLLIAHANGVEEAGAAFLVDADPRRPLVEGLGLEQIGVPVGPDGIRVDRGARTPIPGIFAAGDVTGGAMLSSAAAHQGAVAGENACGGRAVIRPDRLPRVLQTVPGIGWVGLTEAAAQAAGKEPVSATFDLSFNARAVTLGARQGIVKVVASRALGEVLGVHVVGPGATEMLNLAALAMQAEISVHDLSAFVAWHPSLAEGLAVAAVRAAAKI